MSIQRRILIKHYTVPPPRFVKYFSGFFCNFLEFIPIRQYFYALILTHHSKTRFFKRKIPELARNVGDNL